MNIPAAVGQARAWQESIMLDGVLVERRTGTRYDRETMQQVDVWEPVYDGCGRVQWAGTQPVMADGDATVLGPMVAAIPWDVTDVEPGDRLTVTAAALDPQLPSEPVYVAAVEAGTFATCRRLHCTLTDGPR